MKNPIRDKKYSIRVNRGGYWNYDPIYVQALARGIHPPAIRGYNLGFRFVRNR